LIDYFNARMRWLRMSEKSVNRSRFRNLAWGAMVSALREPITGSARGPWAEPLVRESGHIHFFDAQRRAKFGPFSRIFW